MPLSTDNIHLAAAALAVLLTLSLLVSLWQGGRSRRRLAVARVRLQRHHEANQQLNARNQELLDAGHSLEIQLSRLDTELENRRQQLQERDQNISMLNGQIGEMRLSHQSLIAENTELQTMHREREDQHVQQLELLKDTRASLTREFENLANKIFEDKGKSFTATSKDSLESLLQPFREQISGFQQRVNEVHSESVKGNTALESEIKKVLEIGLEMNSQATNLSSALKGDKKTTGNWGEAQLQRTLELAGLQEGEHYDAQAAFRDEKGRRKMPDIVIKLPDSKNMVIDSKVSLVDYDRAIAANSDAAREEALLAHTRAVRKHIDDLSGKDYAGLPNLGSPNFVLMFMPIEPAYIEAMKHNKDLFNYGYNKGVIMVSHTTLMPILRTVANLWMIDKSSKEAREISSRAGEIYNQLCLVAERMLKLGNTLKTVGNHYNDTVKALAGKQGLHGKVERFQQLSGRAQKAMPAVEPLHIEIESERLSAVTPDREQRGDLGIAASEQIFKPK